MEDNIKEYIHHFQNLNDFTAKYDGIVEKVAVLAGGGSGVPPIIVWFTYSGTTVIEGITAHVWVIDEDYLEISGLASGAFVITLDRNPKPLDWCGQSWLDSPVVRYVAKIKATDDYYEPWVSLCEETPTVTVSNLYDMFNGTYTYVDTVYEDIDIDDGGIH